MFTVFHSPITVMSSNLTPTNRSYHRSSGGQSSRGLNARDFSHASQEHFIKMICAYVKQREFTAIKFHKMLYDENRSTGIPGVDTSSPTATVTVACHSR